VPSHGTNRGSNPLRDANEINNLVDFAEPSVQYLSNIQAWMPLDRGRNGRGHTDLILFGAAAETCRAFYKRAEPAFLPYDDVFPTRGRLRSYEALTSTCSLGSPKPRRMSSALYTFPRSVEETLILPGV